MPMNQFFKNVYYKLFFNYLLRYTINTVRYSNIKFTNKLVLQISTPV